VDYRCEVVQRSRVKAVAEISNLLLQVAFRTASHSFLFILYPPANRLLSQHLHLIIS
jgi:hypothetical protein